MEPHKDLKTLLNEALELKNVNHEKLAQITGIPERYIWAIQNIDTEKLPAAPYVRGYIKKISEILHLNHDELWEMYKRELTHKQSGAHDKLPENRFAIQHLSKSTVALIAAGILLAMYLFINMDRLIGAPELFITNPADLIAATTESTIQLAGVAEQRDKLTINGEEIFINPDGTFSKNYYLQPGLNTIEFKAKRLLGKETTEIRKVLYQPTVEQTTQL
jgi:cytoskeletal protein RodZ